MDIAVNFFGIYSKILRTVVTTYLCNFRNILGKNNQFRRNSWCFFLGHFRCKARSFSTGLSNLQCTCPREQLGGNFFLFPELKMFLFYTLGHWAKGFWFLVGFFLSGLAKFLYVSKGTDKKHFHCKKLLFLPFLLFRDKSDTLFGVVVNSALYVSIGTTWGRTSWFFIFGHWAKNFSFLLETFRQVWQNISTCPENHFREKHLFANKNFFVLSPWDIFESNLRILFSGLSKVQSSCPFECFDEKRLVSRRRFF